MTSSIFPSFDLQTIVLLLSSAFALVHFVPYIFDPHGLRKYPGPFVAKFSDIWLGWVSKNGHRSEVVHALHQKYGPYSTHFANTASRLTIMH